MAIVGRKPNRKDDDRAVPVPVPVDDVLAERIEQICRFERPDLTERDAVGALLRFALVDYERALREYGPESCTTYLVE